jgi:hypothetical protein
MTIKLKLPLLFLTSRNFHMIPVYSIIIISSWYNDIYIFIHGNIQSPRIRKQLFTNVIYLSMEPRMTSKLNFPLLFLTSWNHYMIPVYSMLIISSWYDIYIFIHCNNQSPRIRKQLFTNFIYPSTEPWMSGKLNFPLLFLTSRNRHMIPVYSIIIISSWYNIYIFIHRNNQSPQIRKQLFPKVIYPSTEPRMSSTLNFPLLFLTSRNRHMIPVYSILIISSWYNIYIFIHRDTKRQTLSSSLITTRILVPGILVFYKACALKNSCTLVTQL